MAAQVTRFLGFILRYVLVLWLAVTLLFLALSVLRGNPVEMFLDSRMTEDTRQRLMEIYGYDAHPLERYGRYLANVVQGHMGHSFQHGKPVSFVLRGAIGKSLWLTGCSFFVSLVLCFLLLAGMVQKRYPLLRRSASAVVNLCIAVPPFIVAVMLLGIVAVKFNWLPQYGTRDLFAVDVSPFAAFRDLVRHSILPALSIGIPVAGQFAIYLYEQLENLEDAPFVFSARGRGVPPRSIFINHQLRTLLPSFIQLCGLLLPGLAGGVLVIEAIYGWTGMGTLLIDAVISRDYPLLLGAGIVCAALVIPGYEMADYYSRRLGDGA